MLGPHPLLLLASIPLFQEKKSRRLPRRSAFTLLHSTIIIVLIIIIAHIVVTGISLGEQKWHDVSIVISEFLVVHNVRCVVQYGNIKCLITAVEAFSFSTCSVFQQARTATRPMKRR